ncbi:MAG: DUF480 domain-containing protein [Chromatiales bacterium]|jgi:uncharacterized protein YceH (UPF0502 family)|nr:DUF480 domain-containing protein [Chromatiales bacterium]MDH4030520.1 DUF480 domain-containing protein [Chromatiales bacterium]
MNLETRLTLQEARVIGALIEKQIATPDQYPLSLNALKNACNQKSSREPVMDMSESEVQSVLDELARKHLVMERSGFGSRVPKYKQRFCNTEFAGLQFSPQELGIICVLLLRGPQTPGQLRSHTHRLCQFQDVGEVESVLGELARRSDGPFVTKLPREAGRRESRYDQLFGAEREDAEQDPPPSTVPEAVARPTRATEPESDRTADLEARIAVLEQEIALIKSRLFPDRGN